MPGKVDNPWNSPLEPSFPTRKRKFVGDDVLDKLVASNSTTHHSQPHTYLPPSHPTVDSDTSPMHSIPAELGKLVNRDVALLKRLGWKNFVLQ